MQLCCRVGTGVAHALDHKIHVTHNKSLRKAHFRYRNVRKAERAVALITMEVYMGIDMLISTSGAADRIFHGTCSVVDAVYEVIVVEKSYRTRNGRFVYRFEIVLEACKAERLLLGKHGFEYKQPKRRCFYAPALQSPYINLIVHSLWVSCKIQKY